MKEEMVSIGQIAKMYKGAKPAMFVQFAVVFAAMAEHLGKSLESIVRGDSAFVVFDPVPPLDEWLAMYGNHHRIFEHSVVANFGRSEEGLAEVQEFLRLFIRATPDKQRRAFETMSDRFKELLLSAIRPLPFPPDEATVQAILGLGDFDLGMMASTGNALYFSKNIEGQFFARVWFPCWAIYQTYPPVLMRKAKKGCEDSLDKLIRLDKSVLNEPKIARRLHEIRYGSNISQRERMERAIVGFPSERLDEKRLRYLVGGLISQTALMAGFAVTSPEIEALFNVIQRVRHGRLQDELIGTGETFAKAVQRNRIWPSLPNS